MGPGRLGLNEPPTKSIRPCGAEARAGGPGAERSTGRGCVDVEDSEDEARRRAGGPGRGWRTGPGRSHLSGLGAECSLSGGWRSYCAVLRADHHLCRADISVGCVDHSVAGLILFRSINRSKR